MYNHANAALSDNHLPYDTYYINPSGGYNWIAVFDLPNTTVKLNNLNNNALQSLGNFIIKSWGAPIAPSNVVVGQIDA